MPLKTPATISDQRCVGLLSGKANAHSSIVSCIDIHDLAVHPVRLCRQPLDCLRNLVARTTTMQRGFFIHGFPHASKNWNIHVGMGPAWTGRYGIDTNLVWSQFVRQPSHHTFQRCLYWSHDTVAWNTAHGTNVGNGCQRASWFNKFVFWIACRAVSNNEYVVTCCAW